MKRSALKRSPFRRGPRRSTYRRRPRFIDYMLFVKTLPCAAAIVEGHVCEGPIEADHAGERGFGQKAHDSTVIPMCQLAHRQRTDFSGPFKTWNQARMREFLVGRIVQTQRYAVSRGIEVPRMGAT